VQFRGTAFAWNVQGPGFHLQLYKKGVGDPGQEMPEFRIYYTDKKAGYQWEGERRK
jgi:hypothetical protein